MEQAIEAARAIEREAERERAGEESNVQFVRALETAIAVCYWRPFTDSSIGRLDPIDDGPPESSGFGDLHRALRTMRDERYAHTDKKSGRDAGVRDHVTEAGEAGLAFTEGWLVFPREWLPHVIALVTQQRDRFRAEGLELRARLKELGPVDPDEAAQHAAEHKAAALHRLGWETGAGATIWARSIQDELARHEAARARWGTQPDQVTWERLQGSALALVVAIHQVLAFERRVRSLTGDAELAKARARFDAVGPDAKELRDLVAHLDEYAAGIGRRQTGKAMPPLSETNLETFIYWTDGGGTNLTLGDKGLDLRRAANAAIDLAQVVERVRAKHLQITGQEANAAMRRRWGLPPE
jgi:hypothetical protein